LVKAPVAGLVNPKAKRQISKKKSQDDERRATAATATAGEEYRARGRRDVMMNVVVIV